MRCFTGAERLQSELTAAFKLVEPAGNWKLPIKATIEAWYMSIVCDAVVHFTGSVPTFTPDDFGKFSVEAAGYYKAIGA